MITWEYIAGLFDGEGCIHVMTNASGNPQLKLTITQANQPFLYLIKTFTGFGAVQDNKNGVWCWRLTKREDIKAFLANLIPHLILKKAEAETALAICELNPVQGRHTPPEDREKQAQLASQLREIAARRKEDRLSIQEVA